MHGVCQLHPADPEVADLDPCRKPAPGQSIGERDPESVVAQEHVADAGDQHLLADRGRRPGPLVQRLNFVRGEEESMTGLARQTQLPPWIVLDHDGQGNPSLHVLLDRLDYRGPAGEREVEHVARALRP